MVLAIVLDRSDRVLHRYEAVAGEGDHGPRGGGPATTSFPGLALGMESSVWACCVIAGTILASVLIFGRRPAQPRSADRIRVYGVALTGIGMLTLTGNNVAMDSFGPISDNAQRHWRDGRSGPKARQMMDDLDAVGNTTKAVPRVSLLARR